MWPQTEHSLTEVEECQAWAHSAESLSKGLLHSPFLVSLSPSLLQDAPIHVPRPVLVVSLLS